MIKFSALRFLGLGLLGLGWTGITPPAVAEPQVQAASESGTTTYFPPFNAPAAIAPVTAPPATTGAIPASEGGAAHPSTDAPPATAAVTPPNETPAAAPQSPAVPAAPAAATGAAQPAATPAPAAINPVIEAVRKKLVDGSLGRKDNLAEDVAAAVSYFSARTEPLWTHEGGYTHKANAVIAELRKADDWGLDAADFAVPELAAGASPDVQAAAEAQVTLAALKYARFARGGRLDPVSLSNILDMKPPVKDPKAVLTELAAASDPGAYLRGLNPKHAGFERLRQALLKARGPRQEEEPVDPALLIKLPEGKPLKPGAQDDQVALLRQRLKIATARPEDERVYDDRLVEAVRDVQQANGLKANGVLSNRVRTVLNKEGEPKKADPKRNLDRLIVNMERWRWLPANLGPLYVMNNIPEFTSEIWKGSELKLKQKMIVGQPSWPTPVLAANMQFVIFHPSWGMPDGIKTKELLPRLRSASSSGFDFFDQLFGGGSSGARVLEAYKLQAYYNGRPVDANSVNWNSVDIRQYTFTQPPGADNPLGLVKFRFPNSHDVYMHDTPQRALFAETYRALSHGCMRLDEPRRTAEVILGEDKGWSAEKVDELFDGGNEITLDKAVPVYLVYFTARVDDDGRLITYGDIYGHDDRVMSALRGHPVRYMAPEAIDPTEAAPGGAATISDAGSDNLQDSPLPAKKGKNNKKTAKSKPEPKSAGATVQDALSSIFLN